MYTRKNFKKNALRFVMLFTIVFMILLMNSERSVYAAEGTNITGNTGGEEQTTASTDHNLLTIGVAAGDENMASVLQMLAILTVISLAPSILIMLTSFTRIVIVLLIFQRNCKMSRVRDNHIRLRDSLHHASS